NGGAAQESRATIESGETRDGALPRNNELCPRMSARVCVRLLPVRDPSLSAVRLAFFAPQTGCEIVPSQKKPPYPEFARDGSATAARYIRPGCAEFAHPDC